MRPRSIIWFERLYLGAWLVGLLNTLAHWDRTIGRVQANAAATLPPGVILVTTAVGFLIPLLLWFFIARKGSAVAKWILVVLFALGLIGIAFSAVMGTIAGGVAGAFALAATAMQGVAIWFLFQPDTAAWFGERLEGERA